MPDTHQKRAPCFAKSKRAVCKLIAESSFNLLWIISSHTIFWFCKDANLTSGESGLLAVVQRHQASLPQGELALAPLSPARTWPKASTAGSCPWKQLGGTVASGRKWTWASVWRGWRSQDKPEMRKREDIPPWEWWWGETRTYRWRFTMCQTLRHVLYIILSRQRLNTTLWDRVDCTQFTDEIHWEAEQWGDLTAHCQPGDETGELGPEPREVDRSTICLTPQPGDGGPIW